MQLGAIMVATDGSDSAKDAFYVLLSKNHKISIICIIFSKPLNL